MSGIPQLNIDWYPPPPRLFRPAHFVQGDPAKQCGLPSARIAHEHNTAPAQRVSPAHDFTRWSFGLIPEIQLRVDEFCSNSGGCPQGSWVSIANIRLKPSAQFLQKP